MKRGRSWVDLYLCLRDLRGDGRAHLGWHKISNIEVMSGIRSLTRKPCPVADRFCRGETTAKANRRRFCLHYPTTPLPQTQTNTWMYHICSEIKPKLVRSESGIQTREIFSKLLPWRVIHLSVLLKLESMPRLPFARKTTIPRCRMQGCYSSTVSDY